MTCKGCSGASLVFVPLAVPLLSMRSRLPAGAISRVLTKAKDEGIARF